MKLWLTVFSLMLLGMSHLAWSRDWSEKVSVEQVRELIKAKVAEIHPINTIWGRKLPTGESSETKVFFGGGRFRMLLNWIDVNLQQYSYEEVMRMPPPSIEDLNPPVGETDRDLFVKSKEAISWLEERGFGQWDLLDEDFIRESTEAGGSALEKVRVNPSTIEDPFNAIEGFHRGELYFHNAKPDVFNKYRGTESANADDTKIGLIFRDIRQTYDVPRLRISEVSWLLFRKIARDERDLLTSNNWKIQKHLKKLFWATGEDLNKLENILSRLGVLNTLARLDYAIEYKDGHKTKVSKILSSRVVKNKLIEVKTRKELIGELERLAKIRNWAIGCDQWLHDNFQVFIELKSDHSLVEDVVDLFEKVPLLTYQEPFLIEVLHSVSLPEDFLNLLSKSLSVRYFKNRKEADIKANIEYIFGSYSESFLKSGPTEDQITRFSSGLYTIESSIEWHKALFRSAKTLAEFIKAMEPTIENPGIKYIDAIEEEAKKNFQRLSLMRPSVEQINLLKAKVDSIDWSVKLVEAVLPNLTTMDDVRSVLDPGLEKPNSDYLLEIDKLYKRNYSLIQNISRHENASKLGYTNRCRESLN